MDSPHASSKIPLEPALRALAERQRRELGPHLEADELVGYRERALAPAETERVRDHLALCPECAGLLLELDAFSEPSPAGAPELTTGEVEAGWRALAPRLAAEKRPVALASRRFGPVALPWALAATFLAGVIGLSVWTASLRRDLGEAMRPRGLASQVLRAEGSERGDEASGVAGDRDVDLTLVIDSGQVSSAYEAEILDLASNRPLRRLEDLSTGELGNVHLFLPADALAPGNYRIALYPKGGDPRHPTARYRLTLAGR
ncbi:MAG TPA: zf-HC2 domain-containing protein [Thermoanaerobaculia bacterium]